jgi:cytidylate kinase
VTHPGKRRLPIIAIDGPAGAGKTTTAKEVARRLNFLHLDTGAMYRAIALKVLRSGTPLNRPDAIAAIADRTDVRLQYQNGDQRVLLDGEDVTDQLRSAEVTRAVTPVCEVPEVRRKMVQLQRKAGGQGGVVVEGRDIGTVVFPDAELKIFMVADLEERAKRRLLEMQRSGGKADLREIMAGIRERDRRDEQRADSPLQRAADAVTLDTTNLSVSEQVEEILRLYRAYEG